MHRIMLLLVLASCQPSTYAYTPIALRPPPEKPDNCEFEVVGSAPSNSFQEVGTLEFYNGPEPKTVEEFKTAVRKQVCSAGGDAVIASPSDKGIYVKGTIIDYPK